MILHWAHSRRGDGDRCKGLNLAARKEALSEVLESKAFGNSSLMVVLACVDL